MNTKPTTPLPLDFAKMEREMAAELTRPTIHSRASETATQIIAQGIVHLTWKEAEAMGEDIQAKLKDGTNLTAAIQAWAAEWETFK